MNNLWKIVLLGLLVGLASGCQGTASDPSALADGAPASGNAQARASFKVDAALTAFEAACLTGQPSVEGARTAAEEAGITFGRGRSTTLSFTGTSGSFGCGIGMRAEWAGVALPFLRSALGRNGFRLVEDFAVSDRRALFGEATTYVAVASRAGRRYALAVTERPRTSESRGNVRTFYISGTSVQIVTADRVR